MPSVIRFILVSFVLLAGGGEAVAGMDLRGATTQPVGHYEFCGRHPDRCLPGDGGARSISLTKSAWNDLDRVNRAVNRAIAPLTDEENYDTPELWTYPVTAGDCEDYALLKQYMLERAGYPRSSLLLTVLRQANGDGHAVLTVVTDRGDLVLDNLDEEVRDWSATPYVYLKRQSPKDPAKWIAIQDGRDLPVASVR
ncbi:transglutaminase-like cysteine peptidase [Aureimonas psammosilenae]|uniref:transglutaminase-like cysteine peptidase n=1 Tax=Aureimonas psammosilenae TaxID=2495496 RepID=UPI001260B1C8|nr:transglutaminase-like cysteine peptidase [Aureimonas psammosilenae]